MALSDQATVLYLCSTPYAPGREHGVHPLDPDIGIDWPVDVEPILSDKDAAAPSLRTVRERRPAARLRRLPGLRGSAAGLLPAC